MRSRTCWILCAAYSALIFFSFFTSLVTGFGEDYSPEELQEMLFVYDKEFLSSFKIHIKASIPYGWEQPGRYTAELELTGKSNEQFLKLTPAEFGELTYYDSNRSMSYDDKGNLLVWRNTNKYIVLDADKGIIRTGSDRVVVSPQGKVVSSTRGRPRIEKYPANSNDPNNFLFRYILPLGRGYSRLITHIDKVSPGPGGLLTVEGRGFTFSRYPGKWELEVDTEKQYLVTKAVFTRDGATRPTLVCESQGYYDSEVALSQKGVFNLVGGSKIPISLIDYTRVFDEALKTEVLDKVNAAPPETWIMDFNVVSSDGMPLVITEAPPKESFSLDLIELGQAEKVPAPTVQEKVVEPAEVAIEPQSTPVAQVAEPGRDIRFLLAGLTVSLAAVGILSILWRRRQKRKAVQH